MMQLRQSRIFWFTRGVQLDNGVHPPEVDNFAMIYFVVDKWVAPKKMGFWHYFMKFRWSMSPSKLKGHMRILWGIPKPSNSNRTDVNYATI